MYLWKKNNNVNIIYIAQNVDPPQPCVDAATNCKVYGKSVCKTYAQWSSDNCRKYCGICRKFTAFGCRAYRSKS